MHVFRLLPEERAGAVLSELDDQTRLELVQGLDEHEVSRILDAMPSDHVVNVVQDRLINLATAVLAASVIGLFEGSIQTLATLAVFMPIVASMEASGPPRPPPSSSAASPWAR